ncbi:MAG TPA: thiamine pyrophosphate-dependent enzyme [Vicinamibacteria bacterium]|nr:thiamine pyrophosphate-dependent enzyme [Vicinamibacteria bacterium]
MRPQVEPANPVNAKHPEPERVARYQGLDRDSLLGAFRLILLSRAIDDKEIQLKRQNKIFFQINGVGHEAVQVAAGMLLRPGYDWFYPYYRDRALTLTLGTTPFEQFLSAVGAAADPSSGGRLMPSHWGQPKLHILNQSSPTGTQFVEAVGAAKAGQYLAAVNEIRELKSTSHNDEIVYVSAGDGSTSGGEFWESLNNSCLNKLPVLFLIEDNGYAISVPVEAQTAGGNISRLVGNFPDLFVTEFDGCDFVESYGRLKDAVAYLRAGNGPALAHAHVIRPYSHSLSDDERNYKTEKERAEEAKRDPLRKMRGFLLQEGLATEEELEAAKASVDREVNEAADQALQMPGPDRRTLYVHLYSPRVDPTSRDFETEPVFSGKEGTMVDLLNACLRDEMACNPRMVIFGEDVADATREEALEQVKGKGGVFKVTLGLQRRFGSHRVFNTPIAEASIVGMAMGMATRGLKPVAEIQFFDYIWPAYMQIRNEFSTLRWRSNGAFSCPAVIRVPTGGYLTGGSIYHSQSGEVLFTHLPGLRVVMPSTALDANGLLRTAIRCDDPVLFLEHKHLYRQTYNKSPYPGPDYMIPFGRARKVQEGSDLTVITYGALVLKTVLAAKRIGEEKGVSVEILDLRSLSPYDWEAIAESVKKTSRALVAYEDTRSFGYGAEIAARISDELFDWLDAPVRRVAAQDMWVPYHPDLEDAMLPQTQDLLQAMDELASY